MQIITKKGSVIAKFLYEKLTHQEQEYGFTDYTVAPGPDELEWSDQKPLTYEDLRFAIQELQQRCIYYKASAWFPKRITDPETQESYPPIFIIKIGGRRILGCHPTIFQKVAEALHGEVPLIEYEPNFADKVTSYGTYTIDTIVEAFND